MVAGCTSSFYLTNRISQCSTRPGAVTTGCTQMEVGCRPSGQGWELIGWTNVMAKWWTPACFSSDSAYPWDENHQKKHHFGRICFGPLVPTAQEANLSWRCLKHALEVNSWTCWTKCCCFFHRAMFTRESICWNGPKSAPQVWTWARWWCLSMFIRLLLDDVFNSFPEWSSVFLVRVTSNSILEPGV